MYLNVESLSKILPEAERTMPNYDAAGWTAVPFDKRMAIPESTEMLTSIAPKTGRKKDKNSSTWAKGPNSKEPFVVYIYCLKLMPNPNLTVTNTVTYRVLLTINGFHLASVDRDYPANIDSGMIGPRPAAYHDELKNQIHEFVRVRLPLSGSLTSFANLFVSGSLQLRLNGNDNKEERWVRWRRRWVR